LYEYLTFYLGYGYPVSLSGISITLSVPSLSPTPQPSYFPESNTNTTSNQPSASPSVVYAGSSTSNNDSGNNTSGGLSIVIIAAVVAGVAFLTVIGLLRYSPLKNIIFKNKSDIKILNTTLPSVDKVNIESSTSDIFVQNNSDDSSSYNIESPASDKFIQNIHHLTIAHL